MTAREFHLPDLGEGLQEAEIIAWHVHPGDRVVENQPLLSVETDKAVVDIPSPRSGRIEELLGSPGERVSVGALLVAFDDSAAVDTGTVAGSLPGAGTAPESPGKPQKADTPDTPGQPADNAAQPDAAATTVRAIPAARRLAGELGLDLETIRATGPGGVITREDVERAAPVENGNWQELRGLRRSMAENMARAGREVVPATVTGWADVSAWFGRHPPLLRLALGVVHACEKEPALNSHFDGGRIARRANARVDLGIAMEIDEGLLVPVLRDAGGQTGQSLAAQLESLEQKAEQRALTPDELRGATITLSNFGSTDGEFAAMVVMPPQVAIVGAGHIARRPWAVEDRVEVRPVLPLSLTIDHRAVTGVEATRFLGALVNHLQLPDY